MQNQDIPFLGVDVGGTHLKIGLVNKSGEILDFQKEETTTYREYQEGFGPKFIKELGKYLDKYPEVREVGIGLPGLISKDRTVPLEIPAIPGLNGFKLKEGLKKAYPQHDFFLENDAAAAAIGEFYFGQDDPAENFLFVTLGTGIGSALVLDGQVFKGSRGNAMEMGHMLARDNARLETLVGRGGILNILDKYLKANPYQAGDLAHEVPGIHMLVKGARENNPVALKVFEEVGEILGAAIVSTVRILDVTEIYFGGGVSAGLEFILPSMKKVLNDSLTPYYTKSLHLKRATLENDAGTLGAAALCFMGSGL